MPEKTLNNFDTANTKDQVSDVKIFGNPDMWQLLCKASSLEEGWMKSTKGLAIDKVGIALSVTTQQKNQDGSYAIAESVTFIPNAKIIEIKDSQNKVIERKIVKQHK